MKTLYLVRHCRATRAGTDAPLSVEGLGMAERLADALAGSGIAAIVSSPYVRAVASIEPLARRLGLLVREDPRLREWWMGAPGPDWELHVRRSFDDLDLVFAGGESNRAATARAVGAIGDTLRDYAGPTVVVTHGGTLVLLLRHFDASVGWDAYHSISGPDIYRVTLGHGNPQIARVWREA